MRPARRGGRCGSTPDGAQVMSTPSTKPKILLTGATGDVGGRLLRALQGAAYPVRCLARQPQFLASRVDPQTEIVTGDCLDAATPSLVRAAPVSG